MQNLFFFCFFDDHDQLGALYRVAEVPSDKPPTIFGWTRTLGMDYSKQTKSVVLPKLGEPLLIDLEEVLKGLHKLRQMGY